MYGDVNKWYILMMVNKCLIHLKLHKKILSIFLIMQISQIYKISSCFTNKQETGKQIFFSFYHFGNITFNFVIWTFLFALLHSGLVLELGFSSVFWDAIASLDLGYESEWESLDSQKIKGAEAILYTFRE